MKIEKVLKFKEAIIKYKENFKKENILERCFNYETLNNHSIKSRIKINFVNIFINYLKNILIFLLTVNLFCLSFSRKIKINTIDINKDIEYKFISTKLFESNITEIKINERNCNCLNNSCPCDCEIIEDDKFYYIKCDNDSEVKIEITKKKCK